LLFGADKKYLIYKNCFEEGFVKDCIYSDLAVDL